MCLTKDPDITGFALIIHIKNLYVFTSILFLVTLTKISIHTGNL